MRPMVFRATCPSGEHKEEDHPKEEASLHSERTPQELRAYNRLRGPHLKRALVPLCKETRVQPPNAEVYPEGSPISTSALGLSRRSDRRSDCPTNGRAAA